MSYYANEHVSKKFKQNIRRLLEKKRWGAASRLYTKVYGTSPNKAELKRIAGIK